MYIFWDNLVEKSIDLANGIFFLLCQFYYNFFEPVHMYARYLEPPRQLCPGFT